MYNKIDYLARLVLCNGILCKDNSGHEALVFISS